MRGSPIEEVQAEALRECTFDTLEEALGTGAFAGAVLVADPASATALESRLPHGVQLDIDRQDEKFEFGRRLKDVVARHKLERPVYAGSGLALLKADAFAAVAHLLQTSDQVVVSN